MDDLQDVAERFVEWLDHRITGTATGYAMDRLPGRPSGYLWLGRLSPEDGIAADLRDDRTERLSPCAMGVRVLVGQPPPLEFRADVEMRLWIPGDDGYVKSSLVSVSGVIGVDDSSHTDGVFLQGELDRALYEASGESGMSAEVRVEVQPTAEGAWEVAVEIVNTSPLEHDVLKDTNLYEVRLAVAGLATVPFVLTSLPDSYRYDRRIDAYGINCGVHRDEDGTIRTTDAPMADRGRPTYWNVSEECPDLTFSQLSLEPMEAVAALVGSVEQWAATAWSETTLRHRALSEGWSQGMVDLAARDADVFQVELDRMREGLHLLQNDDVVRRAFMLMNAAIAHAAKGRYDGWRPFQMGFLLANLRSLVDRTEEPSVADVIWFATGGGKTETYLGLLVTAALLDRLQGRSTGVTAWSRFPLRMLSLQQTQRFADALAGAELVRRKEHISGDPFSVGFLVGRDGTPNRIVPEPEEDWMPDPDDVDMPRRYQILLTCPFCHRTTIEMGFDRLSWCLEHRCVNDSCPWPERRLPFHIVDDEIYRFLPTVIVGTLDKAASIAIQTAMRGLVGPPIGRCSVTGHGFTYAKRSTKPSGCLVPGCAGSAERLEMADDEFGPRFRLQDEMHLLTDSLGAVDSHYEYLLDDLQVRLTGRRPKVLASSATLAGYEHQVEVLYGRAARVFPLPGPAPTESFWTKESDRLARRFVAVAPRGQTIEFTVDQMLTRLQEAIRDLLHDPDQVCAEADIPPRFARTLVRQYGTTVVYGNTLRDLEAALRSSETQVHVDGALNVASLTGRTPLDEVRRTLDRLNEPEDEFDERIHVVGASSMMSHGVDIDRLNVMVMLGLPLTTAEFIQATARVGRRHPGLIYVIAKIGRERDAAVYRSFEAFVRQGDRFVEPSPITKRSRRVLERTMPGIELARILALHEPASVRSLATVKALREYCDQHGVTPAAEWAAVIDALRVTEPIDTRLREEVEVWMEEFFANVADPPATAKFPSDLCPGSRKPMLSLRDVEEQAPVHGLVR